MGTFFLVLLVILDCVVLLALFAGTFAAWVFDDAGQIKWQIKSAISVVSLILFAALLTVSIKHIPMDDVRSHCGAGTHYISESHLVGKTIYTDWACVAN